MGLISRGWYYTTFGIQTDVELYQDTQSFLVGAAAGRITVERTRATAVAWGLTGLQVAGYPQAMFSRNNPLLCYVEYSEYETGGPTTPPSWPAPQNTPGYERYSPVVMNSLEPRTQWFAPATDTSEQWLSWSASMSSNDGDSKAQRKFQSSLVGLSVSLAVTSGDPNGGPTDGAMLFSGCAFVASLVSVWTD